MIEIKKHAKGWELLDDGLRFAIYGTKAEAENMAEAFRKDKACSELIENAIDELKAEIVRKFGGTLAQAHEEIREYLR